jgi:hypothetical protein
VSVRPTCVLTAGSDDLDLVVEGEAVKVSDDGRLRRAAEAYASVRCSAVAWWPLRFLWVAVVYLVLQVVGVVPMSCSSPTPGLEQLSTLGDLWRGLPMHADVRGRYWVVPAEDVPDDPTERMDWLYRAWERMDAWILENS